MGGPGSVHNSHAAGPGFMHNSHVAGAVFVHNSHAVGGRNAMARLQAPAGQVLCKHVGEAEHDNHGAKEISWKQR